MLLWSAVNPPLDFCGAFFFFEGVEGVEGVLVGEEAGALPFLEDLFFCGGGDTAAVWGRSCDSFS